LRDLLGEGGSEREKPVAFRGRVTCTNLKKEIRGRAEGVPRVEVKAHLKNSARNP